MAPDSQTYGALLIGGLIAMYLSGLVCTQVFLYFRTSLFGDPTRIRTMVFVVWILDLIHSFFVCASVWHYLISGLHDTTVIIRVFWTVSATIAVTGIITFIIHCFFTHRVWSLSKRGGKQNGGNKWITGAIMILAFLRMLSAFGTVIQLQRLKTWPRFHQSAAWSFTTGLAISATVDFLIAFTLCYYLQKRRSSFFDTNLIIDSIMVYTVENGMLTSVSVVASFVCWLTMPTNFVFLALHFGITKMYANSFMATLNARSNIRDKAKSQAGTMDQDHSFRLPNIMAVHRNHMARSDSPMVNKLQISVEKSVHCVTEIDDSNIGSLEPAYFGKRQSYDSTQSPFSDTSGSINKAS